jgi:hypothetical protein
MDTPPTIWGLPYYLVTLLFPFLIVFVQVMLMYATLPYPLFLIMIGLMVAYILPPAGKESIIPIGIALGIPWWYMALAIAMIDIETCLFMVLNFDLAYKIPYLGNLLLKITEKTRVFFTAHKWLAGLNFAAVVLMVMIPVLGSGGVRGSIAGKLLGMKNYLVFLAVLTGTLIGCFGIALASDAILNNLCANGMLPPDISAIVCNGA